MKIKGYIEKQIIQGKDTFKGYTLGLNEAIKNGFKSLHHISIEGNFPDCLPKGLYIECEVEPLKVTEKNAHLIGTEYNFNFDNRNNTVLQNKKVNSMELYERVQRHKNTGYTWQEVVLMENPYNSKIIMDGLDVADTHKSRLILFNKADEIAKKFKYKKDDKRRLEYLIKSAILDFRAERKWQYTASEFIGVLMDYEENGYYESLGITGLAEVIKNDDRLIYIDKLVDKEIYEAKKFIAKNIKERQIHYRPLFTPAQFVSLNQELDANDYLADAQKEAVRKLENTRPTIINGKAGTGKTSTFNAIIKAFCKHNDISKVCLLAPTGKAARRMAETTGEDAKTIHSKLKMTPNMNYICFDETNPLDYLVFIIDESVMIDDLLMARLLKAIPIDAKLYLVGDCNQLYPVGVGEPVHDLIENGNCDIVTLTQNFRQSKSGTNSILKNADAILEGKKITPDNTFSIKKINKSDIKNYIDEKIQNISPYNDLNKYINNEVLAHHDKEIRNGNYFVGEKIIGLKNNDNFNNGDVGTITDIGVDNLRCSFNGKSIDIARADWQLIAPAYSLTVHKCQGSEYDTIRIFLPERASSFVSRRLVYTAVTRAKSKVEIFIYTDIDEDVA